MNKRNNTIRGVLLLVAAALMFSSCAETPGPEEEVTDTNLISGYLSFTYPFGHR